MSTIKVNTWQNPDGTENYKCRAWVNFNGTGTVAIRASGNVSSITDNGAGDYTINFTAAFSDANYGFLLATNDVGGGVTQATATPPTTTAFRLNRFVTSTAVAQDGALVQAAFFR